MKRLISFYFIFLVMVPAGECLARIYWSGDAWHSERLYNNSGGDTNPCGGNGFMCGIYGSSNAEYCKCAPGVGSPTPPDVDDWDYYPTSPSGSGACQCSGGECNCGGEDPAWQPTQACDDNNNNGICDSYESDYQPPGPGDAMDLTPPFAPDGQSYYCSGGDCKCVGYSPAGPNNTCPPGCVYHRWVQRCMCDTGDPPSWSPSSCFRS